MIWPTACSRGACLKESSSALLFSCEHGGNHVPAELQYLFKHGNRVLASHRGLDKGALLIASVAAKKFGVPLVFSEISRLVIDLNRSLHHRAIFSEFTRDCPKETRNEIIERYYKIYREQIDAFITNSVKQKRAILHLSFHSFTPRMANIERNADIGLLYDPARKREKIFCRRLQKAIHSCSDYVVRLNYPYRGNADGLTTALRKKYAEICYAGIEIEVNQKHAGSGNPQLPIITDRLCDAIRSSIID